MKAIIGTLILLILCLLACGCTGTTPAVPPAVSPSISPAGTPPAEPYPVTLSDSHPAATFSGSPGVLVVSFRTSGAQKMVFGFSNQSGGYQAGTDLTTSAPFSGSVAFPAPVNDRYTLNISSTAGWTAEVSPLVTTSPLAPPVNLSGSGTRVTPVFFLEKGQYFFTRNVTGLASPYYFLYYANGTPLMDADNTFIQPGFGALSQHPFVFVTVPRNGTFYLSVLGRENPGPWSVSISPVPRLPPMGPGPEIYSSLNQTGNP